MNVELFFITVDSVVASMREGVRKKQGWELRDFTEPLLDGPVSRRVAVVDLAPENGAVAPGAELKRPQKPDGWARYDIEDPQSLMQVSLFTTVLRVLALFESPKALGRRLTWSFGSEQLLVVPRAGEWANAFYERESKSLQFFYFTPEADMDKPTNERRVVYTSLSPDVVAHEAGHAVLDAIAPDLYDAVTPQALALHEAIADLVAAFFTFEIADLREHVMQVTGGDLTKQNELGWIAEEFGKELAEGGEHYLRSLYSAAHIDTNRPDVDFVDSVEPHDLSVVFSATVFHVLVEEYEQRRQAIAKEKNIKVFSASGLALYEAATLMRRILFRALDYLPPGDVSFADLGRAMIGADAAAFPMEEYSRLRMALAKEFVRRGIVMDADALAPMPALETNPFEQLDLEAFVASDWVAYRFVEKNRAAFSIPKKASFEVRPRLEATKIYYRKGKEETEEKEIIVKVSWTETEQYKNRRGLPKKRRVLRGSTIVIEPVTKKIRLRLSNSPMAGDATAEAALAKSRDLFLDRLLEEGTLAPTSPEDAEAVRKLGLIPAEETAGALRIRSLGRTLHLRAAGPRHEHRRKGTPS